MALGHPDEDRFLATPVCFVQAQRGERRERRDFDFR